MATSKMNVPWAKPYIDQKEFENVKNCFDIDWLTMGPKVKQLESRLSELTESIHCVAVNSGTAALDIALKLIGVKPGDEVIIPALSYIATGNSVLYQKATPVFAAIDKDTYNIDVNSVKSLITDKTKAIIPIDYAGQGPDFDVLRDIIKGTDIKIIEDAAPGLGGKYKDKPLCSRGDIGITSFHMAKIFTTIEGGMIFTDNEQWDKEARIIRSQGENPDQKYHFPLLGHNYRMSDLHAAIGLAQFDRYDAVLDKRAQLAERYSVAFKNSPGVKVPHVLAENEHAWFLYPLLVNDRDELQAALKERGVQTNISWPMPIYDQVPYLEFDRNRCEISEAFCKRVICLPLYFEMTDEEQQYVIDAIVELRGK